MPRTANESWLTKESKLTLQEAKEQMQEDLRCLLDGQDENLIDAACQIVVDNCNKVLNTAE